ncbi:MAG: ATP-binding protein [Gemmatimonadota bacterium]|jgi:two-component system sensor histidine kinase KdpD
MSRRSRYYPLPALALWMGVSGACTLLLASFRASLDQAHMALAYILVVLGASAREGRVVGLVISLVCFLLFNVFLLSPVYSLDIESPLEWWILVAFLVTGTAGAELMHRQQKAVALAEQRAREVARLSEKARHVEALREANRLKDALLASVSHDLRTPLTSIRATAAELRQEGHESAAIIEEEADRLNRFVTDLLDLSRIRGGALPVEPELNAAEDLIGAALERVRGLPGAEGIRVQLPEGPTIPVGRFDFVQALRALVNLLENALRHTPPDLPLDLVVVHDGDELRFEVRDRGPGVDEHDVERLFEPFHRGTEAGPGGTGLGLAIARGAARAQGGDVEYRAREGGGSVFALRLPGADLPERP